MEKRFLTFLMMSTVLQAFVQDVTSIRFRHGLRNFRSSRRNPVRVPLKLPSTKAPATTLRTTGRVTGSKGIRNTQGVSYIYSSSKTKISKSTPSIANVSKVTALKFKTTALIKENDNTSATFDTTQWPATAVSVRNVCVGHNNGVNITQPAPSEASNMKISGNDNIANYSGRHKSQYHNKTRHSDEAGIQKIQEFLADNCCFSASFDKTICSVIAAVQHYFYTSLYTWMLIEGINLYLKIVKVFSSGKPYATYVLIGWGIPGLIVILVAAIQPSTYDMSTILYKDITCGTLKLRGTEERERCWLNGSIWKFKGPVLAMLLANLAIFVIVLRMSFGRIGSTSYAQATRKGLKAIFALLPLLGVTFLLGFFVDFHVAVEYAFVLLTSIQGVLFFICHCVLDDQVRDAMNKMLRKRKRVHSLQKFKQEPKKAIGMAIKKTAGVVKSKTNEGGKSE